jgi:hypothetical protein
MGRRREREDDGIRRDRDMYNLNGSSNSFEDLRYDMRSPARTHQGTLSGQYTSLFMFVNIFRIFIFLYTYVRIHTCIYLRYDMRRPVRTPQGMLTNYEGIYIQFILLCI